MQWQSEMQSDTTRMETPSEGWGGGERSLPHELTKVTEVLGINLPGESRKTHPGWSLFAGMGCALRRAENSKMGTCLCSHRSIGCMAEVTPTRVCPETGGRGTKDRRLGGMPGGIGGLGFVWTRSNNKRYMGRAQTRLAIMGVAGRDCGAARFPTSSLPLGWGIGCPQCFQWTALAMGISAGFRPFGHQMRG